MNRRWIWAILGVLLFVAIFFVFVRPTTHVPTADYDPLDPAIIQITQGTEAEIETLEIGLQFVDTQSAGAQIFDTATNETTSIVLGVGQQATVLGYSLTLIDTLPGTDTAIYRVLPAQ